METVGWTAPWRRLNEWVDGRRSAAPAAAEKRCMAVGPLLQEQQVMRQRGHVTSVPLQVYAASLIRLTSQPERQ